MNVQLSNVERPCDLYSIWRYSKTSERLVTQTKCFYSIFMWHNQYGIGNLFFYAPEDCITNNREIKIDEIKAIPHKKMIIKLMNKTNVATQRNDKYYFHKLIASLRMRKARQLWNLMDYDHIGNFSRFQHWISIERGIDINRLRRNYRSYHWFWSKFPEKHSFLQ